MSKFDNHMRAVFILAGLLSGCLYEICPAQTTPASSADHPLRLAILGDDPKVSTAADLLTVEFSTKTKVTLLERDQITKVLNEQTLSTTGGHDYLKLGQILGADGIIILQMEGKNR